MTLYIDDVVIGALITIGFAVLYVSIGYIKGYLEVASGTMVGA